jgi:glycosidase
MERISAYFWTFPKTMKRILLAAFLSTTAMAASTNAVHAQEEVIYHVFQRSFYDATGDRNGDLRGLKEKVDYLQQLGVTSILLTPLYKSVFYHNYFADDWYAIDPGYGTLKDFTDLARALHGLGMKLYIDMETQYITDRHPWWSAVGHPHSPYHDYLLFDDSMHRVPSPIIWGITELKGYNDSARKVTTVNLHDPGVLAYNEKLFAFFADPNGDGKFDDGVDGFRLDHTMDELDGNPRLMGLFAGLWSPLIARLKKVNPRLTFVAEQANWADFGFDYFSKGGLDRVFAFRLAGAIQSFDKRKLAAAADTTLRQLPAGKQQVVFIENHDMDRFASRVGRDPGKLRVAAALNILLGGIPSIYYGQELGMFGKGGNNRFGTTDANDIPRREAFEWYAADTGRGMALWYKATGPWWDSTNLVPHDGVSVEEEKPDPQSLWNWYRDLLTLRKTWPVLQDGVYDSLTNTNPNVFSWRRRLSGTSAWLAVNLSGHPQQASIMDTTHGAFREVFGKVTYTDAGAINLPPYGVAVWIKAGTAR